MTDLISYEDIGKGHILEDPESCIIIIWGVETHIGKSLYERYSSDNLAVIAPKRDELDISSIQELDAFSKYCDALSSTISYVINCETYFNESFCTAEEFIQRHTNLISFSREKGAAYICLSTDQVFSGSSHALCNDSVDPITLQGSIYSIIEQNLISIYSDIDNYKIYRLPLMFSSYENELDLFEYDLAISLKNFAENRELIKVPSNIYSNYMDIDILLEYLPYMALSFYRGIYNLGSIGVNPLSLYEVSSYLLGSDSNKVQETSATSISGSVCDDCFQVIHPIDNKPSVPSNFLEAHDMIRVNTYNINTHLDFYLNHDLEKFRNLPILKFFYLYDTEWENPSDLEKGILNIPQEYIDAKLQIAYDVLGDRSKEDLDTSTDEGLFLYSVFYLFE